ncbi:MAG: hypothetical protein JW941_08415 [Candidatus Coatesbacteria bacterium]|nr:hypothetical protein [Candidatus Coatesbacteria bacterium]
MAMTRAEELRRLVKEYGRFMEANKKAVKSLNELGKMFSKMTQVVVRGNEPFSTENITHRCMKKHNIQGVCNKLSLRLVSCMSTIDALIDSYGMISQIDTSDIRSTLGSIKDRFITHFWFLKRVLLYDLCDDVMFFSQHKRALGHLTDIRPDVSRSLQNPRDDTLVSKLRSLNEVVRYVHQKGEDAFFGRAREMGASTTFALGNNNILNLVDLDQQLRSEDVADNRALALNEPVLSALLRPYKEGIKGEGAETLNVVKYLDMIDTQLELGLHKARLRSRISMRSGRRRSFISLSYFEPFQALIAQTFGQRIRYFSGVLSRLKFSVETDFTTFLTANFFGGAGLCKKVLGDLVRALISLKDLDELLSQPGKTEKAIALFCDGVSNVHGYFNALRCLELALSEQIALKSFEIILKQEEFSRTEMELLLKHDFPKIAARPNINRETASMLKKTLQELSQGLN